MEYHKKNSHGYKCDLCTKKFIDEKEVILHMNTKHRHLVNNYQNPYKLQYEDISSEEDFE